MSIFKMYSLPMVTSRSELGVLGEDFASEYLKKLGWDIIERNHREKWGELDIIAMSNEGVLVFVEVKTMRGDGKGILAPEDQMTKSKFKKFSRVASMYAEMNESLVKDEKGWRMDVIALNQKNDGFDLRHYENV